MKFKKSPKIYRGYKSRYPKETVNEAKRFINEIKVAADYKENRISNGFTSVYASTITSRGKYICAGKGLTRDLCKASAYAELVERILSLWSPLNDEVAPYTKKFKGGDYRKVEVANFLKNHPTKKIDKKIEWIDSFSVLEEKKRLIPYNLITHISASNGIASGNTLEEAVTHGFCEVFERYSLAEHITKKIETNTIDKGSIKNKTIQNFIKLFESLNIEVEIKDMTLQGKVPVMGVLFTNNNVKDSNKVIKSVFHKELTVGAAIDLELAIIRCFTERAQTFNGYEDCLRKPAQIRYNCGEFYQTIDVFDNYYTKDDYEKIIKNLEKTYHLLDYTTGRSLDNFSYLEKGKTVPFSSLKSTKNKDFLDDIKEIKKILKDNGWDAYIVDYSIKDCFINVVRIIIPSVSDMLRFLFKKGKGFENIKELELAIEDVTFVKIKEKMTEKEEFEFLKYDYLPQALLPWIINPTTNLQCKVLQRMINLAKSTGEQKEEKKIEKIINQIYGFESFLKEEVA